jgi:signal transduction histidine kinase
MKARLSQAWREMWTLPKAFDNEALEQDFLTDYARRVAAHRRLAGLLGLFIDTIYLGWDYIYSIGDPVFAPYLGPIVLNRSVTALAVIPFIVLSLRPRFEDDEGYASRLIILTMLTQFALYCCGFLLAPYPYDYMYFFMGMFICQIYGFSMLRLRARPVFILMGLCLLLAVLSFTLNWHIKQESLISHAARIYVWVALSFIISVGIMGIFVGTMLERSERANFMRTDELNRSNQEIRRHSEEVLQLNAALRHSSQEAHEKAEALIELKERMRQEAERRNREKSQFLAAAVHDLKQPIQAIGNALEPGRQALDRKDIEKARGMFDLAAAATQLMREQLAGVLEISRLESGFVQAELTSFNIAPLIDSVFSQLAEIARRDGVSLQAPSFGEPLIVHSDQHFMGRILLNLLSNGIKYHDATKYEKPWARLAVYPQAACLQVEITDNGQGIAEEHIRSKDVFKPFLQLNNRRRESEKGVGLGLSIVHAMLELMPGHRMTMHSSLGEGTRIVLQIPWGNDAVQTRAEMQALLAAEGNASFDSTRLRGLYVLYVEDDELVRTSTQALCEAYGILCEPAESLEQLREILPQLDRIPDLLFTDYRLPNNATARDVIRTVEEAFGSLPVLVVTGEVMEQQDALPEHWHLLRKPISSRQLLLGFRDVLEDWHKNAPPPPETTNT